ncbi:MAG: hypothetical protein IPO26_15445 [Saprospiraceae bacterium]|nr:hypothetical protein [Saprospiraceae bacterium]
METIDHATVYQEFLYYRTLCGLLSKVINRLYDDVSVSRVQVVGEGKVVKI